MSAALATAPHFRSLQARRLSPHVERGDCWDLVTAAQNGDTDAYGQLYARYYDSVFRFILYRVSDRVTAEDLTSETFLRALKRIDSAHYMGRDVGAWFITIGRNIILDHIKSSSYRLEVAYAEILDSAAWPDKVNMRSIGAASQVRHATLAFVQEETDPADTATDAIFDEHVQGLITRCRRRLTAGQQEVLRLRFDQEYSVAQTAAAMGLDQGAVKALQHRAITSLRKMLPGSRRVG
jgi:RNA polymerase sigma-70 factor (ECF subfamily)